MNLLQMNDQNVASMRRYYSQNFIEGASLDDCHNVDTRVTESNRLIWTKSAIFLLDIFTRNLVRSPPPPPPTTTTTTTTTTTEDPYVAAEFDSLDLDYPGKN